MRVESAGVAFDLCRIKSTKFTESIKLIAISSIVIHKQAVMDAIRLMIHFLRLLRNDRVCVT